MREVNLTPEDEGGSSGSWLGEIFGENSGFGKRGEKMSAADHQHQALFHDSRNYGENVSTVGGGQGGRRFLLCLGWGAVKRWFLAGAKSVCRKSLLSFLGLLSGM